ncbi:MAG: hypothetical protein GY922_04995, partial [Proteobacteria bacterium]|nr:hypothetical protein [Pseudomonadota bacterium]
MQTFVNQLVNQRYLLAVLTIFIGAVVTWGAGQATIESSFNSILSEDDPYREEVDQVNEDFPPSTAVLFAFMPKDGEV